MRTSKRTTYISLAAMLGVLVVVMVAGSGAGLDMGPVVGLLIVLAICAAALYAGVRIVMLAINRDRDRL